MYEILVGEILGAVVAVYALFVYNKQILNNKLLVSSKKLQLKLNEIPKGAWESVREPSDFVSGALGDMGVEGIMNELGIDPGILKNPLVKGLVDKYAPRIVEQLSKKQATGEKNDKTNFL